MNDLIKKITSHHISDITKSILLFRSSTAGIWVRSSTQSISSVSSQEGEGWRLGAILLVFWLSYKLYQSNILDRYFSWACYMFTFSGDTRRTFICQELSITNLLLILLSVQINMLFICILRGFTIHRVKMISSYVYSIALKEKTTVREG